MRKITTALSIVVASSIFAFAESDPFAQMEKMMQAQIHQMRIMAQEMDKMFRNFGTTTMPVMNVTLNSSGIFSNGFKDKGDHYELQIKVDDLKNSKVEMTTNNNILTISVEEHKKIEKSDKGNKIISYSNRSYSESFTLPPNVDIDKISAIQKGDTITVIIPKKNPPKKVEIKKIDTNSSK